MIMKQAKFPKLNTAYLRLVDTFYNLTNSNYRLQENKTDMLVMLSPAEYHSVIN